MQKAVAEKVFVVLPNLNFCGLLLTDFDFDNKRAGRGRGGNRESLTMSMFELTHRCCCTHCKCSKVVLRLTCIVYIASLINWIVTLFPCIYQENHPCFNWHIGVAPIVNVVHWCLVQSACIVYTIAGLMSSILILFLCWCQENCPHFYTVTSLWIYACIP